jgi:hypothetical protein
VRLEDELVDRLVGPLTRTAQQAGDDELLAALITLGDALGRFAERRVDQAHVIHALEIVIVPATGARPQGTSSIEPRPAARCDGCPRAQIA